MDALFKVNLPNNSDSVKDLVELEGLFYFEKEQILELKELPFINEDIVKNHNNNFKFQASDNAITFNKNSLILLEIKNRFPSNDPKNKESLERVMDSILDKVIIFYDIYKERFPDIKKVKLIFF